MKLTDLSIKALKPPLRGQKFYADDTLKGFGIRVSCGGSKTFVVVHGKERSKHTIGRYPFISLSDARDEGKRVIAKLTLGSYQSPAEPFDTVKTDYLEDCAKKNKPRTVRDYTRLLKHFPFGDTKVGTITKRDVTKHLEAIEAPSERFHAQVAIKVFFAWCAGKGYIDASPVTALKAPKRPKKAKRVLSPEELREVLSRALQYPFPFGHIVSLCILTGQRRNEVASFEWELKTDSALTVSAEVAKNSLEHTFPYGRFTAQVFESIPQHAKQSQYIFPASRDHVRGIPTTHFNGWGKCKKEFDETLENVAPYTLHDLRRTFATTLQRIGVPLEVREKLLNHISGTQAGLLGTYNRYGYEEEMKQAIDAYDAYLTELLKDCYRVAA
jgi:integrase